jgi:hypothetical protein
MTRLYQAIVAVCAVAIASGSCGAPPVVKLTPVQVPNVELTKAESQDFLFVDESSSPPKYYMVPASAMVQITRVVRLNGPTPTPNPPPQPTPLSARAILFKDAANKATADAARADTARKLAFGYMNSVIRPYPDADSLKLDVGKVGDESIPPAVAKSWEPFRIEMAVQWDRLRQVSTSTVADYQNLLRDASAGLNASYTP